METTKHYSDEQLAWLALALTPGLGPRTLAALLSQHTSALRVISASAASDRSTDRLLGAIRRDPDSAMRSAAEFAATVQVRGIAMHTPSDASYPKQLRSIPDPPLLLYTSGKIDLVDRPTVAIVGSRDHTNYGRDATREIATAAAAAGIVVVSGMARGLDAVAHQAALDASRSSIGVLGNGIGFIYPKSNAHLYQEMTSNGLLLTENPPDESPQPGAFPRRNRLISGLAQVLVVVEAAHNSGTMLTVTSALEQGRDVMAVPGPINSKTSTGTNQLLRDGATPLLSPDDLLARFAITAPARAVARAVVPPSHLSREEAMVFDVLSGEGRQLDEITVAAGLPVSTTLGVLCGLELGGMVEQLPGSFFRKASK